MKLGVTDLDFSTTVISEAASCSAHISIFGCSCVNVATRKMNIILSYIEIYGIQITFNHIHPSITNIF